MSGNVCMRLLCQCKNVTSIIVLVKQNHIHQISEVWRLHHDYLALRGFGSTAEAAHGQIAPFVKGDLMVVVTVIFLVVKMI